MAALAVRCSSNADAAVADGFASRRWVSPASGGDANGFQTNPTNAHADDGNFAVDANATTHLHTGCARSMALGIVHSADELPLDLITEHVDVLPEQLVALGEP